MTLKLKAKPALTTYEADMRLEGTSAIVGSAVVMAERTAGYYEGFPTGKPAGKYTVTFRNATVAVGESSYEWNGTEEVVLSQSTTQITGAVNSARDSVLSQGNLAWLTGNTIAPDNAGIVAAKTAAEAVSLRLTTVRADALDFIAEIRSRVGTLFGLVVTGDRFSVTALSNAPAGGAGGGGATPTQVTDIVVAARDVVLARGNLAWITGNTVVPDNASSLAAKTASELVRDRLTVTRAAKLDQDFATPTNITTAQTAIIARGDSAWITGTAPDNAGIAATRTAAERLTTTRATRLDTVTVAADLVAIAKTSELTAAQTAIIARGDTAWVTGNTIAPDNAGITAAKTAAERLTTVRAAKLDTVVLTTDLAAIAKTTELNTLQATILAQGNNAWTPNNTAIAATLAIANVLRGLVSGDGSAYTSAALVNAPTGSGGGGGSVGLLPDERTRLFSLPTASGLLSDERAKLLALPTSVATPSQIGAVLTSVSDARIDILNRGDTAWAGSLLPDERTRLFALPQAQISLSPVLSAIAQIPTTPAPQATTVASAVQAALNSSLTIIASDAKGARQAALNNVFINEALATVGILADDDLTELFKFQMLNAQGQPSLDDSVARVRVVIDGGTPTPLPTPTPTPDPFAGIALSVPAVLVLSGQSNWDGLSQNVAPADSWPVNTDYWNRNDSLFRPANPANGFRAYHSPTRAIARAFELAYPGRKLLIVESGQGGAGFANGQFAPGGVPRLALENTLTTGFAALNALPSGYALWAFLWNQGEADASTANDAAAYPAALAELLAMVRARTKSTIQRVLTRINANITGYNHIAAVRSALQTGGDKFVNVDAIALRPNEFPNVHYDGPGYVAVGNAQFDVLKTVAATFYPYVAPPITPPTGLVTSFAGLSASPSGWVAQAVTLNHSSDRTVVERTGGGGWGQFMYLGPKVTWSEYLIDFICFSTATAIGVADNPQNWLGGGGGPALMVTGNASTFLNGSNGIVPDGPSFGDGTKRRLKFSKVGTAIKIELFTADGGGAFPVTPAHTFPNISVVMATAQPVIDAAYGRIDLLRVELVN